MHDLVNVKLLDAKLLVYAKDTHGFINYHTDVLNVWSAILAKSDHYLDFLSRFRLSNRFKSTYNKATLKSLFVLNSTAGRRRQAKSTRPDFGCPSRLGSTYWGRLPGLHDSEPDFGPVLTTNDAFSLDHLPDRDREQLQRLLCQYSEIFNDNPGKTNLCTHKIELKPGTRPIRLSPYRVHPQKADQIRQELDLMIKMGVIEESNSPWASPVVLIPKPDGSIRFCVDYRRLNDVTLPDAYPLPRVEDLIDKIGRAKYLTKIDLSRGYWQVPMDEDSVPVSAFVTPHGQFQWKFMPFGLRNAPGTFQRLVRKVLTGLETFTGAYLDDIIIFSETWDDHLKHLELVFKRIRQANLTIKKAKCIFASAEVEYLGHVVGLGKVAPRSAKVDAILKYNRPTDKKQLRAFLGIAGYYRKFIPHFAQIAACLTNLLRKNNKFVWTEVKRRHFSI